MDKNFFFTEWIKRNSTKEFKELANLILKDATFPEELQYLVSKEFLQTTYILIVYQIIVLNYFGLKTNQIKMLLDLFNGDQASTYFEPKKILERHREGIVFIEKYIKKDLTSYSK